MQKQFRDPETPLTPEQRELRKAILKQIENDPVTFSMDSWEKSPFYPTCKTTRCIEGWAEFIANGEVIDGSDGDREQMGIELLGLTRDEYHIPTELFYDNEESALERMREIAHKE
jgi:hypothetical protein